MQENKGWRGGRLKTCKRKKPARKRTSGESFVLFIICFVELDSVGVLWKQTQMVKKTKKQRNCWTEHRKWDLMRVKMKNRAICAEGWLSKDDLVSFQSFVSLLYSKSRERLFFSVVFKFLRPRVLIDARARHKTNHVKGEWLFFSPIPVTHLRERVCVWEGNVRIWF